MPPPVWTCPRIHRPANIVPPDDIRTWELGCNASEQLAAAFPPRCADFTPAASRRRLLEWLTGISDAIAASPVIEAIDARLADTDEQTIERMNDWLDGHWSPDDAALSELLWRLPLAEQTVSAALWLHHYARFAPTTCSP